MMLRTFAPASAVLMLTLSSLSSVADEPEPPLFVSMSGTDSGNCQNAAAPCRSIDYALQRVGKNGQIRVAEGTYELAAVENIVYLLSGSIDVHGGYRESDQFAIRSGTRTTLVGAPSEYAAKLADRGFDVIVDSKGLDGEQRRKIRSLVNDQQSLQSNTMATPCSGGQAGAFACQNVDLLAHVASRTDTARGADIWGFMDLNTNREYAIIGYSTGTAVFDVTDAENPREVDFVDGQRTTWRDIKVHQSWDVDEQRWNAYAYVIADDASDGLVIIDLSELPQRVSRVSYASDFSAAHNVYLTNTDFSTGLSLDGDSPTLILAGSDISDGRFRSYSLSSPAAPQFIASPSTPGDQPGNDRLYMHDAASMHITDARKDTQCVNAATASACDVVFDFNENSFEIWDVTDPADPVRLSRTPYDNARYTHSGWWSEDQQYLFIQDELDERDRGLPTTLRTFSIANLRSPSFAGQWTGPTNATDHNGFVRGNRYYMSNYSRGLTILDITNPASPQTAGRFDTYPASDNVGFPGAWGTYPFLPSGNVLISDIDSGLYVVADKTLDSEQGTLSFGATSYGASEGQTAEITVRRSGGAVGAIAANWELLGASASLSDVTSTHGTLSWGPGDASDRVINLDIADDGIAEGLERLLIRLSAPGNGATLSAPSIASVYVSEPAATPIVSFSRATIDVVERGFSTAIVVVERGGSASGSVTVDFAITGGSAVNGSDYTGPASGTVSWADGDADPKWIEYVISDDGSSEPMETFDLALSNVSGATIGTNPALIVEIADGSGANRAPNSIAGPAQTVASGSRVTLNGSQSNDPDGDTLSYAWTQTLGTAVALGNPNSASTSFTAPQVSSDTLLRFELTVMDSDGLTDVSTVAVTVSKAAAPPQTGGSGGGRLSLLMLVALAAVALRRVVSQTDGS
jgi:choice-of-anchor B domain-containing protein